VTETWLPDFLLEQHTKNNIINDHKINANGQKDPPKIYPI
jgi:hypothetical protein